MRNNFYLIDAFTDVQFKGNPAGVCVLNNDIPSEIMMQIANEIGVSETAFFNVNTKELRWFTPKTEIALCGHATLATVIAINDLGIINKDENICFKTKSGDLVAKISNNLVTMDFPLGSIPFKAPPDNGILDSFGIKSDVVFYGKSGTNTLIQLPDKLDLINLVPDYGKLIRQDAYGIIVTATDSEGYDFISRYFHPWAGVNEDPVTGSAHCILARYYGDILNKQRMIGYQASARGGVVTVQIKDQNRVNLIGGGVIVVRGNL